MGFKPLVTFCRPVEKGVWATAVENEFGPYTPCATDSLVTGISHLAILGVCIYRIWVTKKNMKVQRFKLRSNIYNYWLGLLAFYSAGEPLFRLIMGVSAFNVDGETGLAPYEIVTLVIKVLAWCCMLTMISLETTVYVYEVRWFVRFSLIYALLGDAVVFGLVLSVSKYYTRYVLYLFVSEVAIQVLFGLCLFVYLPTLDPYPGYTPIRDESLDDAEYEELADGEQVCPERQTNIISSIFFSWMDPLMSLGYKRPLTEKDIWKLDTWDKTETLNSRCVIVSAYIFC
ncbi:putative ABC-type xenobiotic transporter [Helianthus anomalus]